MKTLALIAILTFTIHAQELVSATGEKWVYIASGKDSDGAKFNVYARRVKGIAYPALEVRHDNGPVLRAEHDCKAKQYRYKGGEWVKVKAGSVGAKLVKFACGK